VITDVRDGRGLTGKEEEGVQAAIARIAYWEEKCTVVGGPSTADGSASPSVGLGGLLLNGHICAEIAADPANVGATTSNENTGCGTDDSGDDWKTTGHLGINVQPNQIPCKDAQGNFDDDELNNLAGLLIHEMSHADYPATGATSKKEYEIPAYQHTIDQLCKLLNCPDVPQSQKQGLCDQIRIYYKALDTLGAAKPGTVDPEYTYCPGCPPHTSLTGSLPLTASVLSTQSYVGAIDPNQFEVQNFIGDKIGRLELDRHTGTLSFSYLAGGGSSYSVSYLDFVGAGIVPSTFVQASGTSVFVGGTSLTGQQGAIVEVLHDPDGGVVIAVLPSVISSDFVLASALAKMPGSNGYVLLDSYSAKLSYVDVSSGQVTLLADSASAPGLLQATYVDVWGTRNARTSARGVLIQARTNSELTYGDTPLVPYVGASVWDFDSDGVVDLIQ